MSVDEILSSAPYVFSARKSSRKRTKTGLSDSKNTLDKSVNQSQVKLSLAESTTGYNFPSSEECLRRLGSPVKGGKVGEIQDTNEPKETVARTKEGNKPKRPAYSSNEQSDESVSKQVSPDELTLSNMDASSSIEITAPTSTELQNPPKKLTAADAAANMLELYSACLEGKTTTWDAAQRFPPLLNYLDSKDSQDGEIVREKLGQFIKSVESVKCEVMNRDSNNSGDDGEVQRLSREERLLNLLQIQIWIRIMIWNFSREDGWNILKQVMESDESDRSGKRQSKSKGNRKKGKKPKEPQLSPSQSFVKDIIVLFELAPYVLPPSLEFSKWLKDTLTFEFQQSIPEFGMEILDHFEVEWVNGFDPVEGGAAKTAQVELSSVGSKKSSMRLTSKSLVRGKSQQQAYFSSLARKPLNVNADGESATIGSDATIASRSHRSTSTSSSKTTTQSDREADKALFKKSMSLTAALPKRRENPFLQKSARGVYVGSHFSSKLSNISSLFHEVKAPQKPKPVVITAKRKNPSEQSIAPSKSADAPLNEPSKKVQPDNTSSSYNKTASALAFINNKYNRTHQPFNFQSETPRKRLKPAPESRFANNYSLQANGRSVASTPLQITGETPSKPPAPRGTMRAPINHLSATTTAAMNNNVVEATPLKIIGETPAKQPRVTSRRLRPNSLDGVFVRHSVDMTPRAQNHPGYSNSLYFGLSPMPGQQNNGSKRGLKDHKAKWN